MCITKPQPSERRTQVRLQIEDNYIVETAYLYFEFERSITINSIVNTEGHISGGYNVTVYGNLSYFFMKNIQVRFGEILLPQSDFDNKLSKEYIVLKVP